MGVRVFVLHRRLAVAEALARRLATEPCVRWVEGGDDVGEALRVAPALDVMIVDVGARQPDGRSLAGEILGSPKMPFVLVLAQPGADPVPLVLQGARGWVGSDASVAELVLALQAVARGQVLLPQGAYADVVEDLAHTGRDRDRLAVLTHRQIEVLQCLVEGKSPQEAAHFLFMSQNTVRTHLGRIYAKLGVHSALEAVAIAREAGLSNE